MLQFIDFPAERSATPVALRRLTVTARKERDPRRSAAQLERVEAILADDHALLGDFSKFEDAVTRHDAQ